MAISEQFEHVRHLIRNYRIDNFGALPAYVLIDIDLMDNIIEYMHNKGLLNYKWTEDGIKIHGVDLLFIYGVGKMKSPIEAVGYKTQRMNFANGEVVKVEITNFQHDTNGRNGQD